MNTIKNPQRLIVLLAGLQAFGPLSIDFYLPALPEVARDLSAAESTVQLSISAFLIGLFIGMLFYGPLSDKFGRRRLLLGGIAVYVLASIGCLLVHTAEQLIAWRFVQALGGAAASVLGRAIVRDIFPIDEAARALSLMHLVTMLSALLAPLLASYLLLIGSWRWLFAGLIGFSSLLLIITLLKIPETHRGAARNSQISSVFKAYLAILGKPVALGYILCMSFCFAGMFAYITVSAFVFIEYFGLSPQTYAWIFALNIVGVMIFVFVNSRMVRIAGTQKMLYRAGALCTISSALLIATGFFQFGEIWPIIVGLLGLVSCTGVLGANCTASLMHIYSENAGAAAGVAVATQFGMGALASTIVSALYDNSPFYMTLVCGICGLLSVMALLMSRQRSNPLITES